MSACAHCGVENCEVKFHECLVLDFTEPGYGLVHHLTVGADMLQHNAYTDETSGAMAIFVHRQLDAPPSEKDKRAVRAWADGKQRVARRGPAPVRNPAGGWLRTIRDVNLDTAESYRATVRAWAEAVATTAP